MQYARSFARFLCILYLPMSLSITLSSSHVIQGQMSPPIIRLHSFLKSFLLMTVESSVYVQILIVEIQPLADIRVKTFRIKVLCVLISPHNSCQSDTRLTGIPNNRANVLKYIAIGLFSGVSSDKHIKVNQSHVQFLNSFTMLLQTHIVKSVFLKVISCSMYFILSVTIPIVYSFVWCLPGQMFPQIAIARTFTFSLTEILYKKLVQPNS